MPPSIVGRSFARRRSRPVAKAPSGPMAERSVTSSAGRARLAHPPPRGGKSVREYHVFPSRCLRGSRHIVQYRHDVDRVCRLLRLGLFGSGRLRVRRSVTAATAVAAAAARRRRRSSMRSRSRRLRSPSPLRRLRAFGGPCCGWSGCGNCGGWLRLEAAAAGGWRRLR